MRIAHIEDRFHPEMGYQINFFAKYHNPNHEFIIVCSDSLAIWKQNFSKAELEQKDKAFEEAHNVRIIRLKAKFERKGVYNLWLSKLFKTLNNLNPDVIYTHAFETWTSLRVLSYYAKKSRPLVVTDTHTLYNQFSTSVGFAVYQTIVKSIANNQINNSKRVLFATANENKEIAQKVYGLNAANIANSFIGTDTDSYLFSEEERITIRTQLKVTDTETLLLYAGKKNKLKKPHLILESIASKLHQFSDLKILIVGSEDDDYLGQFIEPYAEKFGAQLIVLPAINSSDLYKYYSAADFAVFPKENTLSALDAQSCRLPLIMEADKTNSERLEKGGLLYETGNIVDLAEKIANLYTNKELRNKLADGGFVFVTANYSYRNIITETEHTIENTLKQIR